MERKEYIKELKSKEGYCECPSLDNLYKQKRKAEQLEDDCDRLRKGLNLFFPKQEDTNKLLIYKTKAEKFASAIKDYQKTLTSLIEDGTLVLVSHIHNKNWNQIKIKTSKLESSLKSKKIITVNCSNCNNIIDLVSDYL